MDGHMNRLIAIALLLVVSVAFLNGCSGGASSSPAAKPADKAPEKN
jgi:hypothetical protein